MCDVAHRSWLAAGHNGVSLHVVEAWCGDEVRDVAVLATSRLPHVVSLSNSRSLLGNGVVTYRSTVWCCKRVLAESSGVPNGWFEELPSCGAFPPHTVYVC
jgi:hypothetical protein